MNRKGIQIIQSVSLIFLCLIDGRAWAAPSSAGADRVSKKDEIQSLYLTERANLKRLAQSKSADRATKVAEIERMKVHLTILKSYARGANGVRPVRTTGDLKARRVKVMAAIQKLKGRSARSPSSSTSIGKLNWLNEEIAVIDTLLKQPANH